ncbi:G-protein coupled receptor 4-like [Hyla sarda]|uniref:G-protein coupled receptor 4-like n=1 Tax=Hyla sarda TaxID=327740 RepID=UPI0024C2790D|nr:G-protein coupled receptor 4-like [Hyla sarda]
MLLVGGGYDISHRFLSLLAINIDIVGYTEMDFFSLYFSDDFVNLMVEQTNMYAQQALSENMSIIATHHPSCLTQDSMSTENTFPSNNTSKEYTTAFCCIYIGNSLLGLTVNSLVMWAIWPQVSSSPGLAIYVVNLLCAALLECLILPFGVAYLLHSSAVGPVGCHVLGLIPKVAQRTATMLCIWIFVVRYVAVSHPLNFRKFCKGRVVGSMSITIWLTAFTISITEQVLSKNHTDFCFPAYGFTSKWPPLHLIISFVFSHVTLILLSLFTYLISCVVKNSDTVPAEQYKRFSRLLVFVVVNFGVFFCPMHIIWQFHNIIILLGKSNFQVQQKLYMLYQMLFTFNSFSVVITPMFYIISSSTVKTRLKGLIKCR